MFEYLPELMKGLHQPDANRCLADCGTDSGIDFYHHPDAENAGAGVAGAGLYHAVYRYAAAGADLPDLLRAGPVSDFAGVSGTVAFVVRTVVMCADCVIAEQCGVYHAAVLRCNSCDPQKVSGSPVAPLGMSKKIR